MSECSRFHLRMGVARETCKPSLRCVCYLCCPLEITYSFTHRAMGTSVNLKNTYAGYSIDLIVKHEAVQDMMNLVGQQIPGEHCVLFEGAFAPPNRYFACPLGKVTP